MTTWDDLSTRQQEALLAARVAAGEGINAGTAHSLVRRGLAVFIDDGKPVGAGRDIALTIEGSRLVEVGP